MKAFFRLVGFGLVVSGWSFAAAAMHVIVTPGRLVLIPKDRLGFHDTYVDARKWTVNDLHQHSEIVARLVHLDRVEVLAFAVDPRHGKVDSQLADAIEHPTEATASSPVVMDKVKEQLNAASKTVRAVFD